MSRIQMHITIGKWFNPGQEDRTIHAGHILLPGNL